MIKKKTINTYIQSHKCISKSNRSNKIIPKNIGKEIINEQFQRLEDIVCHLRKNQQENISEGEDFGGVKPRKRKGLVPGGVISDKTKSRASDGIIILEQEHWINGLQSICKGFGSQYQPLNWTCN